VVFIQDGGRTVVRTMIPNYQIMIGGKQVLDGVREDVGIIVTKQYP